jgi:small-conductance mechanosensitive channel
MRRANILIRGRRATSRRGLALGLALCIGCLLGDAAAARAQSGQAPPAPAPAPAPIDTVVSAQPSGEASTLTFANRPIVVLRAQVLGRLPADRTEAAERMLGDLVAQGITGPIAVRPFQGAALVTVGTRAVVALVEADVDPLSGETVDGVAAEVVVRLRQALGEAAEARAPWELLRASLLAALGLAAGALALWGLTRAHRAAASRLVALAERTVTKSGLADASVLRASRLLDIERALVTTAAVAAGLVVTYATVTFVLRRFPYTRPWGESMRGFLLGTIQTLGGGAIDAVPGLFTVLVIFVVARFTVRLIALWFNAVEAGRVTARWIYPETAQPTRRLLSALVWLFAIIVAYPYLPGSQTDAFKGVSVFLGLMLTLGSSGIVNQVMSGFMVTYSRAVRAGDFVRIGDVEGTVTHLGVLSTKIRTPLSEEVTIPNAVVVAQRTTDYSRDNAYTSTAVTIGYDTPWRQVHALLLMAASRTPGIRREPKPLVLQTALEDFYVRYTLLVSLERPQSRAVTLDALYAQIQDVFNEYGVQIMSPNYVLDPQAPKLVARKDWFAAPACPEPRPEEAAVGALVGDGLSGRPSSGTP